MKILIYGKREFNKFMVFNGIDDINVESQDTMFVSINNVYLPEMYLGKEGIRSYFKRNHSNVLIMNFGDFSETAADNLLKEGYTGVFNDFRAKKLYEFIKKNKNKSLAVIHCGAGVSRSGAVGTFIWDLYGKNSMTWDEFIRKNPRIEPNQHILKLLHKQRENDKSI